MLVSYAAAVRAGQKAEYLCDAVNCWLWCFPEDIPPGCKVPHNQSHQLSDYFFPNVLEFNSVIDQGLGDLFSDNINFCYTPKMLQQQNTIITLTLVAYQKTTLLHIHLTKGLISPPLLTEGINMFRHRIAKLLAVEYTTRKDHIRDLSLESNWHVELTEAMLFWDLHNIVPSNFYIVYAMPPQYNTYNPMGPPEKCLVEYFRWSYPQTVKFNDDWLEFINKNPSKHYLDFIEEIMANVNPQQCLHL
ncbi:hypothetical protein GYMLUDRAFT_64010 [Collybiopsis luxurians FD-317 M1]|uniref:Uncharacterized protein n=1 Tax=Collybiopsis luxurians FD-317 M1 TaxID=944289 RepID=A0A0D0AR91_9AGAR|nr:hypothetical protein GYMLUDRAFT_64010 [Collybiopsis luxurians FD-317 M1]